MFWQRTVLVALVLLGPVSLTSAAEVPVIESVNLKLLTWNIQMLPTSLSFASPALQKQQVLRTPWIIEHLNAQDYDIVVLQEVIDLKITEMLKEGLSKTYPHIVAPKAKAGISGTTGGILFASRVPIRYVTHIVFENISGIDRLAEKGCVLVEGERDGVTFLVAGTHLQAGNATVRIKEFPELFAGIIKPHRKDGVPQFLVGDMNVAYDVRPGSTFQNLLQTTDMLSAPIDDPQPFSVDGHNSWQRPGVKGRHIDHILYHPRGTQTRILRQTIERIRKQHEGKTIDYADHYGVVAEISLAR